MPASSHANPEIPSAGLHDMQVRSLNPGQIRIEECDFYHSMRFPDGSEVRGSWDLRECFSDYIGNIEVSGKTLLDVGTASGFVAFESERRGAEVTAFELRTNAAVPHIPFAANLYYGDYAAWTKQIDQHLQRLINGFWYAHYRFNSRVRVLYGDFFKLPDMAVPADIVVAGAVIEHVSDPISAIGALSKLAKETLVLASTPVIETDECSCDRFRHWTTRFLITPGLKCPRGCCVGCNENVGFKLVKVGSARQYCCFKEIWVDRPTVVAQRVSTT